MTNEKFDFKALIKFKVKILMVLFINEPYSFPCLNSYNNKTFEQDLIFKNFKNNRKSKIIKCGGVILNRNLNKILLVCNNYSPSEKWGLPKGHRENSETYATCATREINEETGLNVYLNDSMTKIKVNNSYYFPVVMNNVSAHLEPIDKNEIKAVSWFKIDELDNLVLNRDTRIVVKMKLNFIKKVIKQENF